MDSEIVVDVSEELLKAVDDWANYLSVSREELIADAVESYLRGRDEPTLITEVREIYAAIESEDRAIQKGRLPPGA